MADSFALLEQLNAWLSGLFKTSTWGEGENPISGYVSPESTPLLGLLGISDNFGWSSTGDSPLSLLEILGIDGWPVWPSFPDLPSVDTELILGIGVLAILIVLVIVALPSLSSKGED